MKNNSFHKERSMPSKGVSSIISSRFVSARRSDNNSSTAPKTPSDNKKNTSPNAATSLPKRPSDNKKNTSPNAATSSPKKTSDKKQQQLQQKKKRTLKQTLWEEFDMLTTILVVIWLALLFFYSYLSWKSVGPYFWSEEAQNMGFDTEYRTTMIILITLLSVMSAILIVYSIVMKKKVLLSLLTTLLILLIPSFIIMITKSYRKSPTLRSYILAISCFVVFIFMLQMKSAKA